MLTSPTTTDRAKKGAVRAKSRRSMRCLRARAMPSRTRGAVTTDALARRASPYNASASAYLHLRRSSSKASHAKTAHSTSTADSVFFCSEIHAADSTATGWTAKSRPASPAPGTRRRRRTTQRRMAATAWSATFARWYPHACSPHSRHSSQKAVHVTGQKSVGPVVNQAFHRGPRRNRFPSTSTWSSNTNPARKAGR